MRTIFTTLTPEATFAVMVVSLILLALLTPLVYRKIQQWGRMREFARQDRALRTVLSASRDVRFGFLYGQGYKALARRWG